MKSDALLQSWLAIQCNMIAGAAQALVIFSDSDKTPSAPWGSWPNEAGVTEELKEVANRALTQKTTIIESSKQSNTEDFEANSIIACPLINHGELKGAVVVEMTSRSIEQQEAVRKLLQWGVLWLQFAHQQRKVKSSDHLLTIFQCVILCLENEGFQAAATAFVTELAVQLNCVRVSFGLLKGKHIKIKALSHSAQFNPSSSLIGLIGGVMDEAMDQDAIIRYPLEDNKNAAITRAHQALLQKSESHTVCTVPIVHDQHIIGGLTFEGSETQIFDDDTILVCEQVASLAGPILELKRLNERPLLTKAIDSYKEFCIGLLGSQYLTRKLLALTALVLSVFFFTVEGEYKVNADSVLEGRIQRVVVAPREGFIVEAHARAGDIVKEGMVLGILDDKDLKLERLKWISEKQRYSKESREAMAQHDRAKVSILNAQVRQAKAKIDLIDAQLERTRLVAPFDGIVIEGDLNQSLGSPVSRGDILFKIAPLDQYRMILKVDEREITEIDMGQRGQLALPGISGKTFQFIVANITPVSIAEEGRNYFRVETRLETGSDQLRPGMEGIGKIAIGRRKLIWIWTHKLVSTFRYWLWAQGI